MTTRRLGPVVLQIPDPFVIEVVGEALIARLPDGGEFEISSVAVLKDGAPVRGGASAYVENRALREGCEVARTADTVWFRKEDEVGDGFVGAIWYAAVDTHVIVITTTIPEGPPSGEAEMNATIESILGALKLEGTEA